MTASDTLVQDVKKEEKAKRLRIIKERAEAVKQGATLTKAELHKQKKAQAKSSTKGEVKASSGGRAERKAKASARTSEADLIAKYPHIVKGTLGYDPKANKATCTVKCQHNGPDCEKTRDIYTSDAFQIKNCRPCLKDLRNAKRSKNVKAKTSKKAKKASKKS